MKHNLNTLGVWCEAVGDSFNPSEGIARVAAILIHNLQQEGIRIVIACPTETVNHIKKTCADLDVPLGVNTSFIAVRAISLPHLRGLRSALLSDQLTFKALRRDFRSIRRERVMRLRQAIRTRSLQTYALEFARLGAESFVFFSRSIIRTLKHGLLVLCNILLKTVKCRTSWQTRLAKKANDRHAADVWWTLNPTWTGCCVLKAPVVASVWDLVYLEHPSEFRVDVLNKQVLSVLGKAVATVSMSRYVRDNHVVNACLYPARHAHVVTIPPIRNSSLHLPKNEAFSEISRYCRHQFGGTSLMYNRYLVDFPFDAVDFIFAASNIRGYKNYKRLAEAMAILIRQHRRNIKLVVTGDLRSDPALWEYLVAHGLTVDIISVGRLPSSILSLFFQCATLSVMPSLFEGGFPLTFSESVSRGTPIAFSNLPTVGELVSSCHDMRQAIFDPLSVSSIAHTLATCLDNTSHVLTIQQDFLARLSSETWPDTARKYVAIFQSAVQSAVRPVGTGDSCAVSS